MQSQDTNDAIELWGMINAYGDQLRKSISKKIKDAFTDRSTPVGIKYSKKGIPRYFKHRFENNTKTIRTHLKKLNPPAQKVSLTYEYRIMFDTNIQNVPIGLLMTHKKHIIAFYRYCFVVYDENIREKYRFNYSFEDGLGIFRQTFISTDKRFLIVIAYGLLGMHVQIHDIENNYRRVTYRNCVYAFNALGCHETIKRSLWDPPCLDTFLYDRYRIIELLMGLISKKSSIYKFGQSALFDYHLVYQITQFMCFDPLEKKYFTKGDKI